VTATPRRFGKPEGLGQRRSRTRTAPATQPAGRSRDGHHLTCELPLAGGTCEDIRKRPTAGRRGVELRPRTKPGCSEALPGPRAPGSLPNRQDPLSAWNLRSSSPLSTTTLLGLTATPSLRPGCVPQKTWLPMLVEAATTAAPLRLRRTRARHRPGSRRRPGVSRWIARQPGATLRAAR
jgi:hypothetical protein